MVGQVAGFPYWEMAFDESGQPANPTETGQLLAELPGQALTDLFIMSHGWNNDTQAARNLYAHFFGQIRALIDGGQAPNTAAIGIVGVLWPAMRWADEAPPAQAGGAMAVHVRPSDATLATDLKAMYTDPAQQQALDELARLLATRPRDPAALARFQQLLKPLVATPDASAAPEDNGDQAMLRDDPQHLFRYFSAVATHPQGGGAMGIGDVFGNLWDGAKEALRAATYWEMKKRAGVVGQVGLGPLIGQLSAAQPNLRIHLVGHSFGARVVSFALSGLPDGATGAASPVRSLFLLQGAFSHFAFASALPFDPSRGGALANMAGRVNGPLIISHTLKDTAVGTLYPMASMLAHDDAAAADDLLFRWSAMGHDGAQAVGAQDVRIGPVGQSYPFAAGQALNLDGNALIVAGGPPSGAHGDIFHPQIAWAALAAAGIVAAAPDGGP